MVENKAAYEGKNAIQNPKSADWKIVTESGDDCP
jgi:hypothetical protein